MHCDTGWIEFAQAIVVLVQHSLTDEEKLQSFSSAVDALATLRNRELFQTELLFLATTAWNRGVSNAKFGKIVPAKAFMEVALSIAPWCNSLKVEVSFHFECGVIHP